MDVTSGPNVSASFLSLSPELAHPLLQLLHLQQEVGLHYCLRQGRTDLLQMLVLYYTIMYTVGGF